MVCSWKAKKIFAAKNGWILWAKNPWIFEMLRCFLIFLIFLVNTFGIPQIPSSKSSLVEKSPMFIRLEIAEMSPHSLGTQHQKREPYQHSEKPNLTHGYPLINYHDNHFPILQKRIVLYGAISCLTDQKIISFFVSLPLSLSLSLTLSLTP